MLKHKINNYYVVYTVRKKNEKKQQKNKKNLEGFLRCEGKKRGKRQTKKEENGGSRKGRRGTTNKLLAMHWIVPVPHSSHRFTVMSTYVRRLPI